ncbi:MAG: ribosome recycling factor [Gammaproteobacteria bacterium]|nr:ribosome recycling factor [Gammaproteobacteria bacterium]|tara:strand:+ start:1886 stop:2443 length:558 start_codon:yes stop_codon:yes gene_type:complete
MLDEIKKDLASRMIKSVASLKQELTKIRTGRAHTSLLDHITVEYYGSQVPLTQVSNVGIEDSRTLIITPWEKDMIQPIEKAIMSSDIGLNPLTAGTVIRVPLPALTEERRKDLIRVVRSEAEGGRIAIRNIRRDAINDIKELLKEKLIGKDELHRAELEVQEITNNYVGQIDATLAAKESELMEI